MKRLLGYIVLLSWALWLGGMIALFIFVQRLFGYSRPLAMDAAPLLFETFERYQLALGGVAIVAAVLWLVTGLRAVTFLLLLLLGLSTAGAVYSRMSITPRMQTLRAEGQSGGEEFKALHGRSMAVYVGQAGLLTLGGLLLPSALQRTKASPSPNQKA